MNRIPRRLEKLQCRRKKKSFCPKLFVCKMLIYLISKQMCGQHRYNQIMSRCAGTQRECTSAGEGGKGENTLFKKEVAHLKRQMENYYLISRMIYNIGKLGG